MNQELFIVFCEKKYEPETWRIVAVFDTDILAEQYMAKLRTEGKDSYNYFIVEETLRTEMP
jgi:uncharacterized protein (DUF427 family)